MIQSTRPTQRLPRGPEHMQPANTERDVRERHEMRLFRALQTARPVYLKTNGRQRFIQAISICMSGGTYEMDIYLAGDPTIHHAADIEIKDEPK